MDPKIIETIRQLEDTRARALVSGDWQKLESLIADELMHIHANGTFEDRDGYLDTVRSKLEFIDVVRESLNVRVLGEVAIATGVLNQTLRIKGSGDVIAMRLATTQVWVQTIDRWVQVSFQATHIRG
jgi:ketosteroid isomerase-like protein